MAERSTVESPFTLGPTTKKSKFQPDLQDRTIPKQKVEKDISGIQMVESLVNFAGVAGSEYIKSVSKKIEADKAVQTSRAVEGLIPTSDATVAGYQAHAAVSIKSKTLGSQARLNELAKRKTTDEEWEEAIREEYRVLDEHMMENYPGYETDEVLQKLSAVSLRETIPQATAQREGYKLEHEINDRINSATDVLVNSAASGGLNIDNSKDLVASVDNMLKPLQLTASQKDQVVAQAIAISKDPALIDKTLQNQKIADNGISLAEERLTQEQALFTGEVTLKEFTDHVKRRNKDLNNKYMTPANFESVVTQLGKNTAAAFNMERLIKKIQSDNPNMYGEKPKEVQAAYENLLKIREDKAIADAEELGLQGDESIAHILNERQKTVKYLGDKSVEKGLLLESWKASIRNLSTMNVDTTGTEQDGKFRLSAKGKQAMHLLDSMTENTRGQYIDSLDNKKDRDAVMQFLHLREEGVPEGTALKQAQNLARNPRPIDFKAVQGGWEEVRDSQEWSWFRKDIPDSQVGYIEDTVKDYIMNNPNPGSPMSVDLVKGWMKNNWTTTKNGTRLMGNAQQLTELMSRDDSGGLHISKIDTAVEQLIEINKDSIRKTLSIYGLDESDVYPVTNTKDGTIALHATGVGDFMGTKWGLSELPAMYATRKNELEAATAEALEAYNKRIEERDKGGQFERHFQELGDFYKELYGE
jgi:hypothetical protein